MLLDLRAGDGYHDTAWNDYSDMPLLAYLIKIRYFPRILIISLTFVIALIANNQRGTETTQYKSKLDPSTSTYHHHFGSIIPTSRPYP